MWAPWIGVTVGATITGVAVHDEEDLTRSGNAMWVGVGAGVGAAGGWLLGKMAGP